MVHSPRQVFWPSFVLVATALGVIGLDQISKLWLPSIVLNHGVSFGVASGWGSLPVMSGILVTVLTFGLTISAWRYRWPWWGWLGIGGILGGGVSNILDRILIGAVRDPFVIPFTNVHNNLADYAIFCGVTLALFAIHLREKHQEPR